MREATKGLAISTSVIPAPVKRGPKRLSPQHLLELATRVFMLKADRWKRRAQFYERHCDYFPRLSASRFIDRCRELEATYRTLAQMMFLIPPQDELVSVRAVAMRRL